MTGYSDKFSVGPSRGYTVGTAAGQYLDADPGRNVLMIQNNGAEALYVGFGAAPTAENGWMIAAGASAPFPGVVDAIYLMAASGTVPVVILAG